MTSKIIPIFLLAAVTFLQACVKTKVENTLPQLANLTNSASGIRLFNFSVSGLDITVNNYPLTSYANGVTTGGTTLGLSLFPTGIWPSAPDGSQFTLPNSLLDKNGLAHIQIQGRAGVNAVLIPPIDTVLQNNLLAPTDYYIVDYKPYFISLPRSNTPPTQAQDMKIRIINQGAAGDPLGLYGPVTLTYADGTPVSPLTSNVAPGVTSPYVELPYGAYEFKVFLSNGSGIDPTKQLAELPLYPNYDACGSDPAQEGIFPLLRTYKPGGDYSAFITSNNLVYFDCNTTFTWSGHFINAYHLITELSPGVNATFARMQGVNALSATPVSFEIDGQPLGSALGFGQPTDYAVFVQGTHQVSVLDNQGNTLVQKTITLYPYDNYCLWAYPKADGTADIDFAAVDMTGSGYTSGVYGLTNDGTNGSSDVYQIPYAWETRFLNLAPDLPYATFMNDSALFTSGSLPGDTTAGATINMSPGYLSPVNPYVMYKVEYAAPTNHAPYYISGSNLPVHVIRAYASSPDGEGEVPGTLLSSVAPLTTMQFIANPALYTTGSYPGEPGVYTAALIGKVTAAPGDPEAARFIVIKHNK